MATDKTMSVVTLNRANPRNSLASLATSSGSRSESFTSWCTQLPALLVSQTLTNHTMAGLQTWPNTEMRLRSLGSPAAMNRHNGPSAPVAPA